MLAPTTGEVFLDASGAAGWSTQDQTLMIGQTQALYTAKHFISRRLYFSCNIRIFMKPQNQTNKTFSSIPSIASVVWQ